MLDRLLQIRSRGTNFSFDGELFNETKRQGWAKDRRRTRDFYTRGQQQAKQS